MTKPLVLLCLLCATAGATKIATLDLRTLATRADRIVLARVESSVSRWTPHHDAIYTDVVLRVERGYKGELGPGEALVVKREGGSVDGVGMLVYGAATFSIGEQVIVFAEHRGADSFVVGMAQGRLSVETIAGERQVKGRNAATLPAFEVELARQLATVAR
jgi:hypothetical protein